MKKFWKIALCLVVCVGMIVPAVLLCGCGSKITAKSVKNTTYYITMAKRDAVDDQSIIDAKFRINFYDDLFKIEYGQLGEERYGFYVGTYNAKVTEVEFEITEYGGAFADDNISKDFVITKLNFSLGKLSIEFLGENQMIIQYEFEKRAD